MRKEQMERLALISRRAVSSLAEVTRLVETAYGASGAATGLAHQAHVHARILLAEVRAQEAIEESRLRDSRPPLSELRQELEDGLRARTGLPPMAHEQIGDELKRLQREVTRLCIESNARQVRAEGEHQLFTWLGKLDHLLRKLRNELDALALRELPRTGPSRVSGFYYGDSLAPRVSA